MSQRSFASAEYALKKKRTRREKFLGEMERAGVHKREEIVKAQADGSIDPEVTWHVAMKRGKLKAMAEGTYKELITALERAKAQVRARVEHPFHVVKNLFRHKKIRYKGLAKNEAQLFSLFGLANIVIAKRRLLALHAQGAS